MLYKIATILLVLFYCLIAFGIGLMLGQHPKASFYFVKFDQMLSSALQAETSKNITTELTSWTDDPKRVHNGYVLLSPLYINNPALALVDHQGEVVHEWHIDKKISNPITLEKHQLQNLDTKRAVFTVEDAVLFPNGDVIFSESIMEMNNYRGQRIARMNKDGEILWEIPGLFHHDMILAEDGNIYSVGSALEESFEEIDQTRATNASVITGLIQIVSTDGVMLDSIPVEKMFRDSDYAIYLNSFAIDITPQETVWHNEAVYDPIHLNSIDYITAEQASTLPFVEAGDLLVSLRGNSTIAIVRPSTQKVVWARKGPWKHQHHVRMNNEGNIVIYDNDGYQIIADKGEHAAAVPNIRILEYNPRTEITRNIYVPPLGKDLYSYWRGYSKRLADGTMIVSSSETGTVLQVDEEGNTIWELRTIKDRNNPRVLYTQKLNSVKYYAKDAINFLD